MSDSIVTSGNLLYRLPRQNRAPSFLSSARHRSGAAKLSKRSRGFPYSRFGATPRLRVRTNGEHETSGLASKIRSPRPPELDFRCARRGDAANRDLLLPSRVVLSTPRSGVKSKMGRSFFVVALIGLLLTGHAWSQECSQTIEGNDQIQFNKKEIKVSEELQGGHVDAQARRHARGERHGSQLGACRRRRTTRRSHRPVKAPDRRITCPRAMRE